jgi:hypothetical protein
MLFNQEDGDRAADRVAECPACDRSARQGSSTADPGCVLIRKPDGRRSAARRFSAVRQRLLKKFAAAGGQRFTFLALRSVSAGGAETAEEARGSLGHASVEATKRRYFRGPVTAHLTS